MAHHIGDGLARGSVGLVVAAAASLILATSASAAPYSGSAYEGFDYGTANDAANDTNDGDVAGNTGGTGYSGAWGNGATAVNVSPGTLSYPGLAGQGNRLTLDATATTSWQDAYRSIGAAVDAGSFYFSFLTRRNNTTDRTLNFALYSGTLNGQVSGEKFAVGQFGSSWNSGGNFAAQIPNGDGTVTTITAAAPVAVGTGVTHLVVGRLDFDADGGTRERVRIYVDPQVTGGEPAAAYLDVLSPVDFGSIDNVRPFAGHAFGTFLGASADFDEIRLGDTYASVVGQAPVPEPSVLGLTGLAAAGLVGTRRRR